MRIIIGDYHLSECCNFFILLINTRRLAQIACYRFEHFDVSRDIAKKIYRRIVLIMNMRDSFARNMIDICVGGLIMRIKYR